MTDPFLEDSEFPWSILRARIDSPFRGTRAFALPLGQLLDEIPSDRSSALARLVEANLLGAIYRMFGTLGSNNELVWLRPYLKSVCERYLELWNWVHLDSAENVRKEIESIRAATSKLIDLIRHGRAGLFRHVTEALYLQHRMVLRDLTLADFEDDTVGALSQEPYDDLKGVEDALSSSMDERREPVRGSVLELLELMEDVLPSAAEIADRTGSRPRYDQFYIAAAVADIWSKLAGRPFPRHVASKNGKFEVGPLSFVLEGIQCFDHDVTFSSGRHAIKTMLALTQDP